MGKIELHSEASDSRCCSNKNPGCACENVFTFDQSIYDKHYVEGRQVSDKDGEKKEIVVDQKSYAQVRKRSITYYTQTSHKDETKTKKAQLALCYIYISTLKSTPGKYLIEVVSVRDCYRSSILL